MASSEAASRDDIATPWYTGLTARHWRILWGSYLGWIFDGYEAVALVYALVPALNSILTPEQAQVKPYSPCSDGALVGCWEAWPPITSGASA